MLRFLMIAVTAAFVPCSAFGNENGALPPVEFTPTSLSADDLQELLQFNSYKFRVRLSEGEKVRVVVRKYEKPDEPAKVLFQYDFVKSKLVCDGPLCDPSEADYATFRIDFKPSSGPMRNVLATQDPKVGFKISTTQCKPSGVGTTIVNPLAELERGEKSVVVTSSGKQLPLEHDTSDASQRLIYMAPVEGFIGRPTGEPKSFDELFPRAEVVLERISELSDRVRISP